ncbi:MAG: hypothetical protein AVO38_09985 [delta proteobacterium ML8_D]|nr:MAG: hypothetical protein AVO38_09985 [delta proteobacterium ML8_D]
MPEGVNTVHTRSSFISASTSLCTKGPEISLGLDGYDVVRCSIRNVIIEGLDYSPCQTTWRKKELQSKNIRKCGKECIGFVYGTFSVTIK